MISHSRNHFENLDDAELLAIAAFFVDEYTPRGVADLWAAAAKRGITEAVVKEHRAASYPGILFNIKCESCRGSLAIAEEHFVAGCYMCSHCHHRSPVRYTELGLVDLDLDTAMSLLLGPSILGLAREEKRKGERRAAIEDGSYWRELRKLSRAAKQGRPGRA